MLLGERLLVVIPLLCWALGDGLLVSRVLPCLSEDAPLEYLLLSLLVLWGDRLLLADDLLLLPWAFGEGILLQ